MGFNPLNAELKPICHFLALLAHHILHVGRIRVNSAFKELNSALDGGERLTSRRRHLNPAAHSTLDWVVPRESAGEEDIYCTYRDTTNCTK